MEYFNQNVYTPKTMQSSTIVTYTHKKPKLQLMPLALVDGIHLITKHIIKIPLHEIFQQINKNYARKLMPINITIVTYG